MYQSAMMRTADLFHGKNLTILGALKLANTLANEGYLALDTIPPNWAREEDEQHYHTWPLSGGTYKPGDHSIATRDGDIFLNLPAQIDLDQAHYLMRMLTSAIQQAEHDTENQP